MPSTGTIARLADHAEAPFDGILGCRMRQQRAVSAGVLGRAGRHRTVADTLEVKAVRVADRRYVVCRNPLEAKKDAAAREAILATLEHALAQGPQRVHDTEDCTVCHGLVALEEEDPAVLEQMLGGATAAAGGRGAARARRRKRRARGPPASGPRAPRGRWSRRRTRGARPGGARAPRSRPW